MSVDWLKPGVIPPGAILAIAAAPTNAEWAAIDRAMGAGLSPAEATLAVLHPVGKIGALALRAWNEPADPRAAGGSP